MSPNEFYIVKGVAALVATVLIVINVAQTFKDRQPLGQRLRYAALLYLTCLVCFASADQAQDNSPIQVRNVASLVGMVFVNWTMVMSLREDRARQNHD